MTCRDAITWLKGIRDAFHGDCMTDTLIPISRCEVAALDVAIKVLEENETMTNGSAIPNSETAGPWVYRMELFEGESAPKMTWGCSACGFSIKSLHAKENYCPRCGIRLISNPMPCGSTTLSCDYCNLRSGCLFDKEIK